MKTTRLAMTMLTVMAVQMAAELPAAYGQEVRRAGFTPIGDHDFMIIEQFYEYDASLPLVARLVESSEDESGNVEKIVFTTSNDERVPGFLTLPKSGSTPYPCVLLLHGLNNSKDWWRDDDRARTLTASLVQAGIATFMIDLRYHGERAAANDYQLPMYLTYNNNLYIRNRDMLIQSTIDARRALDYLKARADVDSTRVAVVGYSMGGMLSLYLSALEPWLTAAVACAVPSHLQLLPADHYNFAARSMVPTLLLAGTKDWHTSAEDARTLLSLLRSGDKELQLYDSGHRLPAAYAERASAWLIPRLKRSGRP